MQQPPTLRIAAAAVVPAAEINTDRKPHTMSWTDGAEEAVKLILAAVVGGLYQRVSIQSKLSKLEALERDIAALTVRVNNSATKDDVGSLKTIMEIELRGLSKELGQYSAMVARVLDSNNNHNHN